MKNGALEGTRNSLAKLNQDDSSGPIFLGRFTEAPGVIAVAGIAGAIVAAPIFGTYGAAAVLLIAAYDAWDSATTQKKPTIDVKAHEVEVDPEPTTEELIEDINILQAKEFERKLREPIASSTIITPPPVVATQPLPEPWEVHQEEPIAIPGRDLIPVSAPVGQTSAVTQLRSALELDIQGSKPVYEPRVHPEKPVIHTTEEVEESPGLCDRIVGNLESLLIIGNPGAGKAMLMSNLIPLIRAKYPELKIVGIDPKGDPKETGYWEAGFDEVYRCNHIKMEDRDYIKWFKDKIDKLKNEDENVLYVIDEWTATCRKFAKYDKGGFDSFISFMVGVGSSGPSRRMFVWGIGQIPHAAAMGVSGGERAIFRPIAIASDKRIDMASQFVGTSFVPSPVGGIEGLQDVMRESPRGRAVYYDGWEPMPELTNHSGFDRDRFEFIDPPAIIDEAVEEVIEEPMAKAEIKEVDIDSMLSFLDEDEPLKEISTVVIDAAIKGALASTNDKKKMYGELLVILKEMGDGFELTAAMLATEKPWSAWAGKWSRSTRDRKQILPDRGQKTISGVLDILVEPEFKFMFLERVDETTYRVTLR